MVPSTTPIARVQHPAPDFKSTAVVDGTFKEIKLADYTSQGQWVVLGFVPMAWTFVCPTEIIAYAKAQDQFKARNTTVIFASTDSEYTLLSWNNTSQKDGGLGNLTMPLLSDRNLSVSRAYGVLLEDQGISLRGLFIIDPKGIIRQITINDLPVGRSVEETIRLIDAFQFTEEHGEVCPANWRPGADSIKATPTESKQYFEKVAAKEVTAVNGKN